MAPNPSSDVPAISMVYVHVGQTGVGRMGQSASRGPEAGSGWRRLAELAALLDEEPGSKRRELREILARGRLPVEARWACCRRLRPVPIPVEVPLGRDRLRLRQLAEQTDPATEPILGLLTLVRALGASRGGAAGGAVAACGHCGRVRVRWCCTTCWASCW